MSDAGDPERTPDPLQGELLALEESLPRLREAARHAHRLVHALAARDAAAIRRLLDARPSRTLPREVREEAIAFLSLPVQSMRAPMQAILHARRTAELLDRHGDRRSLRRAG